MNIKDDTLINMFEGSFTEQSLQFNTVQTPYKKLIEDCLIKSKLSFNVENDSQTATDCEFMLSADGNFLYKVDFVKGQTKVSEVNILLARLILMKGPAEND